MEAVSLTYKDLPREVKAGDRLLLADGLMELLVESSDDTDIICKVVTGGILTSHKGINLPTGTIRTASSPKKIAMICCSVWKMMLILSPCLL